VGGASALRARRSRPHGSVLDPFKPRITRLLDTHPYSAQQIFQRLREEGYRGGVTILRDYVHRIRPTKRPVYLKLHFAPGECAQVDWVPTEPSRWAIPAADFRSSSWCWRLAAKCSWSSPSPRPWSISSPATNTLLCFGGVPSKIMVDNLKSAVLQRLAGAAPVFNPRYLDLPATMALRSRLQCRPRQREGARRVRCGLPQLSQLEGKGEQNQ